MRILILTQYFWPEDFRINDLAQGLKERGYQVTILTGKPNYPSGDFFKGYGFFRRTHEQYNAIDIFRVPLVSRGNGSGFRLLLNYISFAFFSSLLGPMLCREKYDCIFVYEPSPITIGIPARVFKKLTGAPILFWVQDLWPESLSATGAIRNHYLLRIVEGLVKFIYRGCDRILVQSSAFVKPITQLGVEEKNIRYFPNSAEELYRPMVLENDSPEKKVLPKGFRIMFAGNIGAAQDFETILNAAVKLKEYTEIQWVIIGAGRLFNWVEEQVSERGLSDVFHLLGRHPVESMPRFFSLADVLLVTLKNEPIFSLTIPSKIQSYLACGKPIIAAIDGEGARVVSEAKAGLTTPGENSSALSKAVLKMYHISKDERELMGKNGRKYYEDHFERNMLLDRLSAWLFEIKKSATA